ncbi:general transcription repressor [Serendipita sp. 411]|nr:general transcription repressor [Serendipita sp. 401]KAG8857175.1 general transcription repressor [Serendipita sp. 411]KAG8869213.1 general transcription repressor [Serendipita sp. 405]
MSHSYSRQPSSKSSARGGVPPVDEGPWQGGPPPPHSQSNRGGGGYAPGPGSGGPAPPTMSAARLAEMLDIVRSEFDGVMQDNSNMKVQREEFEARAAAQLNELVQIKNAVQELENVHYKARVQYEEELAKLRAEIQALRAANPPHSGHMSAVERNGPPSGHPNEPYERNRGDRELPHPKVRKPPKEEIPEPLPRGSPRPAEPPRMASPPYEFPGSLSPSTVPATLRKEGPDWFAMYNPRLPQKTLDVSLLHQFNHESVVCCVRFSKDGKFLATGCNRTAQIFDMATGEMVCQLSDDKAVVEGDLYIRSVCFSPDGKYLATGAEDRQIRIWDIAKRRIRNLFEGHDQEIYSLDFSSTGHLIVSGSGDRTARIWDMETGKSRILSIEGNSNPNDASGDTPMNEGSAATDAGVTSVAISPDGRLVAAGSLDTVVRLWDVQTGNLLEKLKGHRDSVYSVAFTPDGRGLVSGSLDKTLKYWELNTSALKAFADGKAPKNSPDREPYARAIHNFVGHKDYVLSVAISHDGQWVVSGSKDRGVQFWDKYGTAQLMLQGHKNSVISIDLSPTGGSLATGSGDWQARVWTYNSLGNAP